MNETRREPSRAVAAAPGNRTDPLAMSKCVLSAAGGA